MLNENAKLWVAALRSGEYQQTTGRLTVMQKDANNPKITVGDCCLGVACKVAVIAGLDLKLDIIGRLGDGHTIEQTYDGEVSVLPEKVVEWLGLSSSTGMLLKASLDPEIQAELKSLASCSAHDGKPEFTALTSLNDTLKFSFAKIADVIETEPIGLFRAPEPQSGPV